MQSFKPTMLVFIPWDVIKLGLLIYLYLLGKYLFIYWVKCPWGKDRSGRSLGGCSDHRVIVTEWSFSSKRSSVKVPVCKADVRRGPWTQVTLQRKMVSHRIGLISYPFPLLSEVWALCKGDGWIQNALPRPSIT